MFGVARDDLRWRLFGVLRDARWMLFGVVRDVCGGSG
jgi:hypothetical protein